MGAVWQILSETVTDLLYLPGQRHAGDPAGTAICPQAAQHIFGTSTLAGLPPVASCGHDMLMPKHPMQVHGFLLRQPGATSNSWGGFFSPKKPCSSPTSKRYTDACQPDLQRCLPGSTFQTVTSMLFSHLAGCLHTETPHSPEDTSDAARVALSSDTPVSSDLRSC